MAHTKIFINNTIHNLSLQVGDIAYVSTVSNNIASEPIKAGLILDVQPSYIIVNKDKSALDIEFPTGISGMFLMFEKRIEANDSSLKGYFANITLENYSNKYAELYMISSETTLSSK